MPCNWDTAAVNDTAESIGCSLNETQT